MHSFGLPKSELENATDQSSCKQKGQQQSAPRMGWMMQRCAEKAEGANGDGSKRKVGGGGGEQHHGEVHQERLEVSEDSGEPEMEGMEEQDKVRVVVRS
eukprot:6282239-Pyramimonas_sp.AAC.1